MVKLNCAAFPQTMIEGELFGYMKGAFTGATNDFRGMIAEADGSTLFLDEISEMPAELQTRFLRVLQEREFRPLGSTKTLKADFRVDRGDQPPDRSRRWRKTGSAPILYYRLNTFQIEMPPLRERKEDIPPLVALFVKSSPSSSANPSRRSRPEAFQKLLDYSWPGNVRELQNAMEYAVVLARQNQITREGIAGRSAVADRSSTGGTTGRRRGTGFKAWTTWSATPSSRRSPNATGTRRKPPSCSGSSGRLYIIS